MFGRDLTRNVLSDQGGRSGTLLKPWKLIRKHLKKVKTRSRYTRVRNATFNHHNS